MKIVAYWDQGTPGCFGDPAYCTGKTSGTTYLRSDGIGDICGP